MKKVGYFLLPWLTNAQHPFNDSYEGSNNNHIAYLIGGILVGMLSLEGTDGKGKINAVYGKVDIKHLIITKS